MIEAFLAVETHIVGEQEQYPQRVAKGAAIGKFATVSDLYQHLRGQISVDGPRGLTALWGECGYMHVSVYVGEDYAQNAAGHRIGKYCD